MMIDDVYSGTLGTMFDRDKLTYLINEYILRNDEPLNYEIVENDTLVVLITGRNDEEKNLPMWSHPIIFTNTRKENVIAMDMRPFMANKLDDMITLRERMQDKYNGTLQLYRVIFTKLLLDEEDSWLTHTRSSLIRAISKIISSTVSMILYDKNIIPVIEMMTKLHYYSMYMDNDEFTFDALLHMLSRDDIQSLTRGDLKELYSVLRYKVESGDLIFPSATIGSLVNNIKAVITNGRADGLTVDILLQALSRGFYSSDSKYLSVAMIEDLPTLISVIVMVETEGINSKSMFRKILDSNKRILKTKEMGEILMRTYKDEIIEI